MMFSGLLQGQIVSISAYFSFTYLKKSLVNTKNTYNTRSSLQPVTLFVLQKCLSTVYVKLMFLWIHPKTALSEALVIHVHRFGMSSHVDSEWSRTHFFREVPGPDTSFGVIKIIDVHTETQLIHRSTYIIHNVSISLYLKIINKYENLHFFTHPHLWLMTSRGAMFQARARGVELWWPGSFTTKGLGSSPEKRGAPKRGVNKNIFGRKTQSSKHHLFQFLTATLILRKKLLEK